MTADEYDVQPDVPHVIKDESTGKYIAVLSSNGIPVAFMLTDNPPLVMNYSTKRKAQDAAQRIMEGNAKEPKGLKYQLLSVSPRLILEVEESPFIGDDDI